MLSFPSSRQDWRFDVISLLAVIGESAMDGSTQPLTASYLCLLPRIIPAPQVLLKSSRPTRLPSKAAIVVGVHSGTLVQELNYFADLIHPIAHLPAYTFREYTIRHNPAYMHIPRDVNVQDHKSKAERGMIKTKRFAPLKLLTAASALLSLGLLIWSILLHDGVACLAIVLISLVSSLTGIGSLWRPKLTERKESAKVNAGDVVVRTRHGAFIVVHCTEEVIRELYTGAEECSYYIPDQWFKVLVGTGTVLLMVSVVLMGNCNWVMQCALGVAFITLNGLYWTAALLPKKLHWDLDRYIIEKQPPRQAETFTQALWYAVKATQAISWVSVSRAAPDSPAWRAWIDEAYQHLDDDNFDAQACITRCMLQQEAEQGVVDIERDRPGSRDVKEMRDEPPTEIPFEAHRSESLGLGRG